MKTSSKILLAAAGAVFIIIALGIVGMRFYVDRFIEKTGVEWSEEDVTGSVTYYGEVREQSRSTEGIVEVKRKGR
jgi:multidrug efflux pump subunit AcrA (membrane-fusion protein)